MRDPQKATPGGSGQAVAERNTESPHMVAAGACLDKQRHPLSAAFGDMPADEFAELVADIKRNGQISDIVKAADGSILDGWHRYRACIEAGITPRIEPFSYIIEAAAEVAGRTMTEAEFVIAQNAHRRHLTAEQRRRVVAELLKADPAKSDRAIGGMAKVDHKTVAAVRRKAEATGEIPQLTKTTGKDGKARPTKPAKVRLSKSERKAVEKVLEQKRHALLAEAAALNVAPQPEPATAAVDATVAPAPSFEHPTTWRTRPSSPPERRMRVRACWLSRLGEAVNELGSQLEELIGQLSDDDAGIGRADWDTLEDGDLVDLDAGEGLALNGKVSRIQFALMQFVDEAEIDPDLPTVRDVDGEHVATYIGCLQPVEYPENLAGTCRDLLELFCSEETARLSRIASLDDESTWPPVQDARISYADGRVVAVRGAEVARLCFELTNSWPPEGRDARATRLIAELRTLMGLQA